MPPESGTRPIFEKACRNVADFAARLDVIGDELGPGYGEATVASWAALAELAHVGVRLDTTYSAKAAALLLRRISYRPRDNAATVFWATKSALALPTPAPNKVAHAPERVHEWLRYELSGDS